mmetsp:Transcript_33208/g.77616  ORF Transcript_33208/g.77616 Transcript_33208/m.77616 type:complete len:231 (-) Transcript_33208:477-1169(-)
MRLRLRHLVLVVRELEVGAARVEVHLIAQQLRRHRRALDVPAGPPLAPWRRPRRLARLGALPEREIRRRLLLAVGRRRQRTFPLGEQRQVANLTRLELAVPFARLGKGGGVEVDRAVGLVAVAVGKDALDVRDDLGHIVGDPGDGVGRHHVEGSHVRKEGGLLIGSQLEEGPLHIARLKGRQAVHLSARSGELALSSEEARQADSLGAESPLCSGDGADELLFGLGADRC